MQVDESEPKWLEMKNFPLSLARDLFFQLENQNWLDSAWEILAQTHHF